MTTDQKTRTGQRVGALPDLAAQERAYLASEARTAYLMRYLVTQHTIAPMAKA